MSEYTKNNAIALLEECLANGHSGPESLYAWFTNAQGLIDQTIYELEYELDVD